MFMKFLKHNKEIFIKYHSLVKEFEVRTLSLTPKSFISYTYYIKYTKYNIRKGCNMIMSAKLKTQLR